MSNLLKGASWEGGAFSSLVCLDRKSTSRILSIISIGFFIKSSSSIYRLAFKIFSIYFDNASANTASIRLVEEYLRPSFGDNFFNIRCSCRVLNLFIQTRLESLINLYDQLGT